MEPTKKARRLGGLLFVLLLEVGGDNLDNMLEHGSKARVETQRHARRLAPRAASPKRRRGANSALEPFRPAWWGRCWIRVVIWFALALPAGPALAKKPPKDGKKATKIKWSARLMSSGGYRWRPARDTKSARNRGKYEIRQARLRVTLKKSKWRLKLSTEFADGIDGDSNRRIRYVRNAYAEYRPHKTVRLRMGVFKRPYSRLALTSASETLSISRGLTYRYAVRNRVRQLSYGMRAPGIMVRTKFKSGLGKTKLYASLSMPGDDLRDIAGSLMLRQDLGKAVQLDLYSTYKHSLRGGKFVKSSASGLSLGVDYAGFSLLTEMQAMQNWREEDRPWGFGALAMAYYGASAGERWQLGPTLSAEWLDRDLQFQQSEAMRVTGGLHARWNSMLRLWLEGEWISPLGGSEPEDVDVEKQLFVRLQLALTM